MIYKGHYDESPNGYAGYKFDGLASVIADTQLNAYKIKAEFKKLAKFYKANPDVLYESLAATKDVLEEKQIYQPLSDFELASLKEINNIFENNLGTQELFYFEETYFLDDFRKVYRQIMNKSTELLLSTNIVDIVYYSLETHPESKIVPIGEKFRDGSVNTGSKLLLKLVKLDHVETMLKYQVLFN